MTCHVKMNRRCLKFGVGGVLDRLCQLGLVGVTGCMLKLGFFCQWSWLGPAVVRRLSLTAFGRARCRAGPRAFTPVTCSRSRHLWLAVRKGASAIIHIYMYVYVIHIHNTYIYMLSIHTIRLGAVQVIHHVHRVTGPSHACGFSSAYL